MIGRGGVKQVCRNNRSPKSDWTAATLPTNVAKSGSTRFLICPRTEA
jgi:hypothetical protein